MVEKLKVKNNFLKNVKNVHFSAVYLFQEVKSFGLSRTE